MNKHIRNTLAALSVIGFIVLVFSKSSSSSAIEPSSQPSLEKQSMAGSASSTLEPTTPSLLPQQAQSFAMPVANIKSLPVVDQAEAPRSTWQAIQGAPEPFVVASA